MKDKILLVIVLLVLLFCLPAHAGVKSGPSQNCPSTYTFEDLNQGYKNHINDFYFDNSSPPADSHVALPNNTPERSVLATRLKTKTYVFSLLFPWSSPGQWRKGDVIFQRTDSKAGQVVKNFSTLTHVSLMWDPSRQQVLESMVSNGVAVYDTRQTWGDIVAFCVKRLKNYVSSQVSSATDAARNKYQFHTPYFPAYDTHMFGFDYFINHWADKHDTNSMYCSKLVWWVFKDAFNIDMDSNRTRCLFSGQWEFDRDDYGNYVNDAWIGVSPDDLYYSKYLGPDIYTAGTENLLLPFAYLEWE